MALKGIRQVKETSLNRLQTVWVYLCNIFEKTKVCDGETDQWFPEVRDGSRGWLWKNSTKEI